MTQRGLRSWVMRVLWKFDADDVTRCRRKVKWFAVLVICILYGMLCISVSNRNFEYQRYWICNYIDTHRYNIGQITQCRLVQNVQNMCICSSNPDPWFWWALLPLASRATLCLWAPLGHFHIKAPTDFGTTPVVERGPLFSTYCAPLTAYVNNVRHRLNYLMNIILNLFPCLTEVQQLIVTVMKLYNITL